MTMYVYDRDALSFINTLEDGSVSLLCTDPPFYGIVAEEWDNAWPSTAAYAEWFCGILHAARPKLTPTGSVVFFGAIGKHGHRPLFPVMGQLEAAGIYTYRNWITWKKRRAYGKSHDYLFCREEILWYSVSAERTEVTFNIPLTSEKRGYAGFDPKYPAKSEYKRVSNVWDDIPELMRPVRTCQKPIPLMRRLIETHSNPGDLVIDPFSGTGATGMAALMAGRRFRGTDADPKAADYANIRCSYAANPPKEGEGTGLGATELWQ